MDNLLDTKAPDAPALDPNVNYLEELVGQSKKFKTPEELAYGKAHSDAYIKILERQLDSLKTDYAEAKNEISARAKFEDLVTQLNKKQEVIPEPVLPNKPEINMTEIETLLSRKIQENETQKKQRENLDMVKAELAKRFGDNLENHLREVGLDGESAAMLAKTNPQLVLKALGVDKAQEPGFTPPPRNTSGFTPKPEQKRTWAYYQDMFKKQPTLKYDAKINTQMQKDYAQLGSAFEDGDFNRFG
jgi:hypothetical protein